jgi:hypothetical protein
MPAIGWHLVVRKIWHRPWVVNIIILRPEREKRKEIKETADEHEYTQIFRKIRK